MSYMDAPNLVRPSSRDAGQQVSIAPEDIAATIVFLASAKADFITGQIIGVNGGKIAL